MVHEALPPIITLDIKLAGWREIDIPWSARMEVPADTTLLALHYMIQRLVDFDNDHLHSFYYGPSYRSREFEFGEAVAPFEVDDSENIPLAEILPLPKKRKLYYHFDYGADWVFEITYRARVKASIVTGEFPRIVWETGSRPDQYEDAGW